MNEFFAYDAVNRVWTTKAMLPLVGQSGIPRKAGVGLVLRAGPTCGLLPERRQLDRAVGVRLRRRPMAAGDWTFGAAPQSGRAGHWPVPGAQNALYALRGGSGDFRFIRCRFPGFVSVASRNRPGIRRESTVRTSQFALRIAPNPFSGVTRVSYNLPVAGNVSLRLYDVIGKLVSTLDSGHHPASSFCYSLLATHYSLAPGIYLLRLESNAGSTTPEADSQVDRVDPESGSSLGHSTIGN